MPTPTINTTMNTIESALKHDFYNRFHKLLPMPTSLLLDLGVTQPFSLLVKSEHVNDTVPNGLIYSVTSELIDEQYIDRQKTFGEWLSSKSLSNGDLIVRLSNKVTNEELLMLDTLTGLTVINYHDSNEICCADAHESHDYQEYSEKISAAWKIYVDVLIKIAALSGETPVVEPDMSTVDWFIGLRM